MAGARAPLRRLRKRSEFLRAARGKRTGRSGFSLQAAASPHAQPGLGLTVTKKTGNAPERNRIRRRLRAAAGACADRFRPRNDYVIVGRREALGLPFATLVDTLATALDRLDANPAQGPRNRTQ
jgi:ribonuclease P protein component